MKPQKPNSFLCSRHYLSNPVVLLLVSLLSCGSTWNISSVLLAADDKNTPNKTNSPAREKPIAEIPKLQPASAEASAAIGSFKKPDGMTCDLFAAEPMLGNPVAFAFDNQGRIIVCESYRQNNGVTDNRGHDEAWLTADLAAMTVTDRIRYHRELLGDKARDYETQDDLLRLLVDTDGDFVADKATVFASGFNSIEEGTGAGALIRNNTVYYTNIPKLWALVDKNEDGVADDRVVLSDGYGVRVAFRGHDMHGLILGPDGRLYFSIGDRGYHIETPNGILSDPESGAVFRCELDGSKLEVFATGLRNPQELAFDDFGNLFTGDNNSDSGDKARWVNVVRGGDSGWRMMYQYISDRGPFNREKIWFPFNDATPAYTIPPIANVSDGPSGLTCYPGTGLTAPDDAPNRFQNAFFLVDFRGQASNSGIRMIKVKPNGAFFELESNEEFIWNILGTDADFSPDGGLYVSDWVNGWNGENKGRLYRFADTRAQASQDVKATKAILNAGVKNLSPNQLGELLGHIDRRVRLEAQWELASRQERSILIEASKPSTQSMLKRLHAVWGLGQILRGNPNDSACSNAIKVCFNDSDPWVVARAIEMAADAGLKTLASDLVTMASHESSIVKAASCMALGKLQVDVGLTDIIKVLAENNNQDPILRHAGIMGLVGVQDSVKLQSLKTNSSEAVRLAAVVALRKQANPIIAEFLGDASTSVIKEAVRAIHDVPKLHAQLASVADLPLASNAEDAVVHRVLNACFRLGRKQDAIKLANFAASSSGSEAMRLEALEMLASWSKPGLRDRVMNRHLPLADRNGDTATQAIRDRIELLSAAPAKIRDKFLEIGASMGITEISQLLQTTAKDSKAPGARRAAAIRALSGLEPQAIPELIAMAIVDSDADVRIAGLGLQVVASPEKAISNLAKSIESTTPRERQFAWDQLGTLELPEAKRLLSQGALAYLDGILPSDCRLNVAESVAGKLQGDILKQWELNAAKKQAALEQAPQEYYVDCTDGGDVNRGRNLFFTRSNLSCVRCHKVGQIGGEVGPALGALGTQKSRAYLLEAIVAPNTTIAQGFETAVILDTEGNTVSGIIKSEDDEQIVLMDAQGAVVTIEKEAIEARRKGSSSMPADLMKYLNQRELRDLVAYLASLDGSPEATVGLDSAQSGHQVE